MKRALIFTIALLAANNALARQTYEALADKPSQRAIAEAIIVLRKAKMLVPTQDGYLVQISRDMSPGIEMLDVDAFESARAEYAIPRTEYC